MAEWEGSGLGGMGSEILMMRRILMMTVMVFMGGFVGGGDCTGIHLIDIW